MDKKVKEWFTDLSSADDTVRMKALQAVLERTEHKVGWAYEVWDDLLARLDHPNSFQRSIAVKVLCNLAKSDSENRLKESVDRILAHTRDEKFITSRQCLQTVWKIAAVGGGIREKVLAHLELRFMECSKEKHGNLLRQDVIQAMRSLADAEKDTALLVRARKLAAEERSEKHRRKFEAILHA